MRFLLVWVVLQPQPGSRTASHKQSSPRLHPKALGVSVRGWKAPPRAPRGHPGGKAGQHPEAEACGSSSSSLPGVVSHPRAAEVKGSWHLVLNRWQKQQEAKIPRTLSSDVVLGIAFFFFPSSIKNLSILQVVSWVFYDLLHRFDLKRCYFLTHTLESFKYRELTIKKNKHPRATKEGINTTKTSWLCRDVAMAVNHAIRQPGSLFIFSFGHFSSFF